MYHNGLSPAKLLGVRVIHFHHMVSFVGQFLKNVGRYTRFEDAFIALKIPESGGIKSGLHSHIEFNNVEQYLNLSLWLHKGTHNTKGEKQITILEDHGWDYGVIWPLVRLDTVGMTCLQGKCAATGLQQNTGIPDRYGGAKRLEKAIDKRDAVALTISYRQVNRIFASVCGACLYFLLRLLSIKQLSSQLGVRLRQKLV